MISFCSSSENNHDLQKQLPMDINCEGEMFSDVNYESVSKWEDKDVKKYKEADQKTTQSCHIKDLDGLQKCKSTENVSADEFDSCFDDLILPLVVSNQDTTSIQSNCNRQSMMDGNEKVTPIMELKHNANFSDDEFDSCFDDLILPSVNEPQRSSVCKEQSQVDEGEQLSSSLELEKRLNQIMEGKKRRMPEHIRNESKHFKTITSTVEHLNSTHNMDRLTDELMCCDNARKLTEDKISSAPNSTGNTLLA